ncbi:MAG: Gfo/Idh/MocA family oxidoreductase [Actinomycetota bacterium]
MSEAASEAPVGVGVVGARSMVARLAVLPALETAPSARVVAVASRGGPVEERWVHLDAGSYEAVIDHGDVVAVYVPLPNDLHVDVVGAAARAGRHVLCEKPLAPDAETAREMQRVCDDHGVLLAEAWMTPFHRRWSAALDLASAGTIGRVTHQDHCFTFTIGPEHADNYRWAPEHGGGALLDVGIYTVGTATRLFGPPDRIENVETERAATGVDARTTASLSWDDGRTADVVCSFIDDESQRFELIGESGRILVEGDAYTGGPSGEFEITVDDPGQLDAVADRDDVEVVEQLTDRCWRLDAGANDPYLAMVDAFGAAVSGTAEWPRPIDDAIGLLDLLDHIAAEAA